jgi:hypothetical protein
MSRLPVSALHLAGAAVLIVLLAPIAITPLPPLLDYPNHLARLYLLQFGAADPILGKMYRAHWSVVPNLAFDVLVPPLLRFVPVLVMGRLILAAIVVAGMAGVFCYAKACFGRVSWWQLGVGLVTYHDLIIMGFINFDLSIGLALLFAAHWIARRDAHPVQAIGVAIVAAAALFFVHIFGMVFYLILIGSCELSRIYAARGHRPRALLVRGCGLLAVVILPFILSRLSPAAGADPDMAFNSPLQRLTQTFGPFLDYWRPLDIPTGCAVLAALGVMRFRRWIAVAPEAIAAGVVLAVIIVICPDDMMETGFVRDRFPAMAGLLLFAGLRTLAMPKPVARAFLLALGTLFVVHIGEVGWVWRGAQADVAEFRQAIQPIPPGSKVLSVIVEQEDNPGYWSTQHSSGILRHYQMTYIHLPALVVFERRAFWPYLFTSPLKQPLTVLPAYADDSVDTGMPASYRELETTPSSDALDDNPFLEHWQSDFDYVLVLSAGGLPDAPHWLPEKLEYVRGNRMTALYRVRH